MRPDAPTAGLLAAPVKCAPVTKVTVGDPGATEDVGWFGVPADPVPLALELQPQDTKGPDPLAVGYGGIDCASPQPTAVVSAGSCPPVTVAETKELDWTLGHIRVATVREYVVCESAAKYTLVVLRLEEFFPLPETKLEAIGLV